LSLLFIYLLFLIFPKCYFLVTNLIKKLRTLKKHFTTLKQTFKTFFTTLKRNCYEFRTLTKTLLMNICDFVKLLTNFKKQTACLKQNFKPYFTMLKRNFTKFVNRKIAIKLLFSLCTSLKRTFCEF